MNSSAASERAATLAVPPDIEVPSPTGIDVRVVLAGPGARSIAFVIDFLIRSALAMAYLVVAAWAILGNLEFDVPPDSETLWYLAGMIPASAIYFLYHLILEPLMAGRTPGKRMIGLRVLTAEGVVPGVGALLTRNLFRVIDSMPVFYLVGLMFVMFGRRHVRLGDLAAGTVLAVERAPFLEKLRPAQDMEWQLARRRRCRGRCLPARRTRGSARRSARRISRSRVCRSATTPFIGRPVAPGSSSGRCSAIACRPRCISCACTCSRWDCCLSWPW